MLRVTLLAALVAGCNPTAFACIEDGDCASGAGSGWCEADGFCSFPDEGCESGRRYGEHSGTMSETCVPLEGTTGVGAEATSLETTVPVTLDGTVTVNPASDDGPATSTTVGESSSTSGEPMMSGTSPTTDESTSTTSTTSTTSPPDGEPLLRFEFDEIEAGAVPNLGTLGGEAACESGDCPELVDGHSGNGAEFEGQSCLRYPWAPEFALSGGLTVAAWVRRDVPTDGFNCILCKPLGDAEWDTWQLALFPTDMGEERSEFRVGAENSGVTLRVQGSVAEWTHVAGTWDGGTITIWIDGDDVLTMATETYDDDQQDVFLGCDDDHGAGLSSYLVGVIDQVVLYDYAMDAAAIQLLMESG